MTMRYRMYVPGSLVILRQLDVNGNVATIWGGEVLRATPKELTVRAIEMHLEGLLEQNYQWHCVGDFQVIKAPPHKEPYQWDFPRLLKEGEASDLDLRARPVLQRAVDVYKATHAEGEE
jgi:hypothetical protein